MGLGRRRRSWKQENVTGREELKETRNVVMCGRNFQQSRSVSG